MSGQRRIVLATAVLWGAIGVAAVGIGLSAMRLGPALHADSAAYVGGATNLAQGRGFSRLSGPSGVKPITVHAPGYPLALAGLQLAGLEVLAGARILNAVLFGLNCVIVGVAIRRVTSSAWAGVLGSLVMAASPTMIDIHSWALSEPLYIFLAMLGLWLLAIAMANGRIGTLASSALALGLAFLTRYVGGTLVATGGLVVLVSPGRSRRWRLTRLGVFIAVGLAPISLALLRNRLVAGTLTNRSLVFHPMTLSLLKRPFSVVWNWLVPIRFGYGALGLMVAVCAIALVVLVVGLLRRERRRRAIQRISCGGLSSILGLYVVAYGAGLLISLSFFDAAIPIDDRTMSPVYGPLVVLVVGSAWSFFGAPGRERLRPLGVLLAASLLVSFGLRSTDLLRSLATEPRGFAALAANQGGGLPQIELIPAGTTIYTNNLEALYLIYGRGGFVVPEPMDPMMRTPNSEYASTMERVVRNVEAGAVVVMFEVSPGELDPLLAAGLQVDLERGGVVILSR